MTRSLDIFRALGDATRLRIVQLVRRMELSVGELAQVLGQSQPRVSRHVKILCDAGLPSATNTQLPSLRRSASPASHRILTWRDTRGWLCPSTCASSPTDSSIERSSARMRSRVASASARKISRAMVIADGT